MLPTFGGDRSDNDESARKSETKDADARAVDPAEHRPPVLDDNSVPLERRIILAEEHRLAG